MVIFECVVDSGTISVGRGLGASVMIGTISVECGFGASVTTGTIVEVSNVDASLVVNVVGADVFSNKSSLSNFMCFIFILTLYLCTCWDR